MSRKTYSLSSTSVALGLPGSGLPSCRSNLRNVLYRIPRAVLLAAITLFLCFSAPGVVKADWVIYAMDIGDPDDDFTRIEHVRDTETGKHISIFFWKDDVPGLFFHDNPDPEGGGVPKGDLSSRIDLAKQHGGGKWVSAREVWDSELGRYLGNKGKGPGPVINPADDDVGGGPGDPSRGKEKLGEPLLIDKTGSIGSGKGGGFQFNAGSPAEQLKKPGGPGGPGGPSGGGGNDDGDDKGSSGPPPGTNYGPAELVDPLGPPVAKRTTKETTKLKTVKIAKSVGDPHKRLGKTGKGDQSLGGPDTKSLGGPDTKKFLGGPDTRIALGGPDTKSVTGAGRISSMGGGSAFRMVSPRVGSLGAGAGSFRVR
jgi:hypothetical protein